jgi:hypothetical protein
MPQIRYIPAPATPVRRYPKSVQMSVHTPNPYRHSCGKDALLYADGVIWCEYCGRKVAQDECTDKRRSPSWR